MCLFFWLSFPQFFNLSGQTQRKRLLAEELWVSRSVKTLHYEGIFSAAGLPAVIKGSFCCWIAGLCSVTVRVHLERTRSKIIHPAPPQPQNPFFPESVFTINMHQPMFLYRAKCAKITASMYLFLSENVEYFVGLFLRLFPCWSLTWQNVAKVLF